MNRHFFISLLLHGTLLLSFTIGSFFHSKKRGIEIPNDTAIIVNFTKIGPESRAPIIGQPNTAPKTEEAEKQKKSEKIVKETKSEKILPKKGDIAKTDKKNKEKSTKLSNDKKQTKSPSPKVDRLTGPVKLTPDDAQRADAFGLEIIASEASVIKSKLDHYWSPPEIAENSGVKIRVYIGIDYETGRIRTYHILERSGPAQFYAIFESRISFVLNNPEIDFMELSEETRKMLSERGLEIVFDADTTGE